MSQLETEVELVDIDDLIPYSNNPKEHPSEQVDKIASSIKNYGWDQPIVVDGDNEIIKGHGRLQAAKKLQLGRVPVIQRTDLSHAEARAARIADNKTSESSWLDDELATEVEILNDTDPIDVETLGFDDDELDSLISEASLDDEDIAEAFGELPDGERDEVRQRTFTLSEIQLEVVEEAIDVAKEQGPFGEGPNDNENGNAIHRIAEHYLETV